MMVNDINFLEPWYSTDQNLVNQLKNEISNDHILFGQDLKTIARRQDNDDVLFKVMGSNLEFKYAVVHLTWAKTKFLDKNFPRVRTFKNENEVYNELILVDNKNWEE